MKIGSSIKIIKLGRGNTVADPSVFVSYSSRDERLVEHFVNVILNKAYGMRPGVDYYYVGNYNSSAMAGEPWSSDFKTKVRRSKLVIAFVDEFYFHSQNCKEEWSLAKGVEGRLFPVLLRGSYGDLPSDAAEIQIFNAGREDTWDMLVEKLRELDYYSPHSQIDAGIKEWLARIGRNDVSAEPVALDGLGVGLSRPGTSAPEPSSEVQKILKLLGYLNFENVHLASDFANSLCEQTYIWTAVPGVLVRTLNNVAHRLWSIEWEPENEGLRKKYSKFKDAIEKLSSIINVSFFPGDSPSKFTVERLLATFKRHPSLSDLLHQREKEELPGGDALEYYMISDNLDEFEKSDLLIEVGVRMQAVGDAYRDLWFVCFDEILA